MRPKIGIDLGTTKICLGLWYQDKIEIIASDDGNTSFLNYLGFTDTGRCFGDNAKNEIENNVENTVFNIKRIIGRKFHDEEFVKYIKHSPFRVLNRNGMPIIQVEYKNVRNLFTPEELIAMLIGKLKDSVEAYIGITVTDAVISVPAYFNDSQRQATKDAGAIAGLNVLGLISEPTASAITFALDKDFKEPTNLLVFDLGGGCLDVSLMTIKPALRLEVKATAGDTNLGGIDFDARLISYFIKTFKKKFKKDPTLSSSSIQRLALAAEWVKISLSTCLQASLELDSFFEGIDYHIEITRYQFEELCSDLFTSVINCVEKVLKNAKMQKSEIHEIVMAGGCSRIPKIQSLLINFLGGKCLRMVPDEGVAYGATIRAANLSGQEVLKNIQVFDISPMAIGIEGVSGIMSHLIDRHINIPYKQVKTFTTFGNYQPSITFPVYEGDRSMVRDNPVLGIFELSGIPPVKRGIPQIYATFTLDADGILNVTAEDCTTGKSKNMAVKVDKGRLSAEEIEKFVYEIEGYKEDDRRQEERSQVLIMIDNYISSVKITVEKNVNRLNETERKALLGLCDELIKWSNSHPYAEGEVLTDKLKDLQRSAHPLMMKLKQSGQFSMISQEKLVP